MVKTTEDAHANQSTVSETLALWPRHPAYQCRNKFSGDADNYTIAHQAMERFHYCRIIF